MEKEKRFSENKSQFYSAELLLGIFTKNLGISISSLFLMYPMKNNTQVSLTIDFYITLHPFLCYSTIYFLFKLDANTLLSPLFHIKSLFPGTFHNFIKTLNS